MSKRPASTIEEPAAKRFLANPDAQGVLIRVMAKDMSSMQRQIVELKEERAYLHRQVERLDGYSQELEGRLGAVECVVSTLLARGDHRIVEEVVAEIRGTREHDMTDLDRMLDEYETEEEVDWFDIFLSERNGE